MSVGISKITFTVDLGSDNKIIDKIGCLYPKKLITMPRWFYEKKELRQSPSVHAGMDPEMEARYRREGARFIIDLGSSMKLTLTTMATGVVYFHRFYMVHCFQGFSRYPTACACLFLAGKVEETPKKCKDMIKTAKTLLPESKFAQFGDDERNSLEEVMTLERILLQTIKFELQVEHPYTFLLKYAKSLKGDKNRLQKMVQMAWTFINDSFCTTLCLQWEPEIVAIALMYLAGKLSKFEVVDWNGRNSDHLRWWDMFVSDMSIDLLEDICHQVLDLYAQTQTQPPGDSPPQPPPTPTSHPSIPSPVRPLSAANTPTTPSFYQGFNQPPPPLPPQGYHPRTPTFPPYPPSYPPPPPPSRFPQQPPPPPPK